MATDLKCPYCGCMDSEVYSGRNHPTQNKYIRYRRCENIKCRKTFTSEEFVRDGKRVRRVVETKYKNC
jgi:transcriptional regulator NrdR family protein